MDMRRKDWMGSTAFMGVMAAVAGVTLICMVVIVTTMGLVCWCRSKKHLPGEVLTRWINSIRGCETEQEGLCKFVALLVVSWILVYVIAGLVTIGFN